MKDPETDTKKEHPCGKCVWRSFTFDGTQAGCYKTQKLVDKPCKEYTEK